MIITHYLSALMKEKVERIIVIITITVGISISILDLIGILGSITWMTGRTPAITLLVLAIMAAYMVSERVSKLNRIESLILENTNKTLASLSGVEVKVMKTSEEAFEYLTDCIKRAELKVDHLSLAPGLLRSSPASKKWDQTIGKILKGNRITYRYIRNLRDKAVWERVKRYLNDPEIHKYFVSFFDLSEISPPVLNFVIFDDREMLLRTEYEFGQTEIAITIKHSEIVRLFSVYFENTWKKSIPLNKKDIEKIEKEFLGI